MKNAFFFLMGAVFFSACAPLASEIKFPYKYFHISPSEIWDSPGKLLGEKQEDDHLLGECKPKLDKDGKPVTQCVVVFYSELTTLISDYKNTKADLISCQKGIKR
jgi:hypothetical protein